MRHFLSGGDQTKKDESRNPDKHFSTDNIGATVQGNFLFPNQCVLMIEKVDFNFGFLSIFARIPI